MRDSIRLLIPGATASAAPPPGPLSPEWLDKLAKIRGGLFAVGAPARAHDGPENRSNPWVVSSKPRPWKFDSAYSCDYIGEAWDWDQPLPGGGWALLDRATREQERTANRQAFLDRKYTHTPYGPFFDVGYHGENPQLDIRLDGGADALRQLNGLWAAGIIPICFMAPDNWSIADMKSFEPIFRSPAWQQVVRMTVPGWEPSMDRSNDEWVHWFEWLADLFPHALRYIHLVADFDAPGNNQDLTPTLSDGRPNPYYIGNAQCWTNLAPFLHGYLNQTRRFENPDYVDADERNAGRTNYEGWADDCDPHVTGGSHNRFHSGYAGWPTWSAWRDYGRSDGVHWIAAEWGSYSYHNDIDGRTSTGRGPRTEDEVQSWGDTALARGADGVLDGFHAP